MMALRIKGKLSGAFMKNYVQTKKIWQSVLINNFMKVN